MHSNDLRLHSSDSRCGAYGPVLAFVVSLAIGCTDSQILDTGDTLVVAPGPGIIYVSPAVPSMSADCAAGGGAVIDIVAQHSDGTAAGNTQVELWLTGGGGASLSSSGVRLAGDGTNSTVCVRPGDIPGAVTVHARSGVVEATASVQILALVVPDGGSLALATSPISATMAPSSSCGVPATTACFPGQARSVNVTVQGIAGNTEQIPAGAAVNVTTSFGWLSSDDCANPAHTAAFNLALQDGVAGIMACFPDGGGTATLTARSGSVTATTQVMVPTIARSIVLLASQGQAAAGDPVSFLTFVSDCAGQGVADASVAVGVTSGALDFDPAAGPIVKTGPDGTATISGKARAVPLQLGVQVIGASELSCAATIAAEVTP